MNTKDIITLARSFKENWNTNDPYEIAKKLGIRVNHTESKVKGFTAHIIKMNGYPTVISINNSFSSFSKKVLCAHELGHALLHENCINHFAITSKNVSTTVELEANLFAIALLTDDDIDDHLIIPLSNMNNYLLKAIMDHNIY